MVRRQRGAVSAGLAVVLMVTTLASCGGSSKVPASTIGASGGAVSGVAAPPLADGTYYGYSRSFDIHSRALRFARVEFANNPHKAQQLCEQNGVPVPPEGELCHDYYLKDDKVVIDSTASKSVRITDWHKFNDYTSPPAQGNPYQFSLSKFAQTVGTTSGRTELFQFIVKGGGIVAINGIYLP